MSATLISVIMPVYNSEKYVGEAIESIINQEFTDFEFIIVDDGSTDNSLQIILSYDDPRIHLITHKTNMGNYSARNEAMHLAQGKYICVMDSDDISMPDRLLTQFNFMEYYPDYIALGSLVNLLYTNHSTSRRINIFDEDECKVYLLQDNVFIHPSLIFRKETLLKHNLFYNEKYYYAADFDLVVQLSKLGNIGNIPSFLLNYRVHPDQISCIKYKEQQIYADMIRLSQISQFNLSPTQCECVLHLNLMAQRPLMVNEIVLAEKWTDKLLKQNEIFSLYNHQQLYYFLKEKLLANYRNNLILTQNVHWNSTGLIGIISNGHH